jgi:thiol-disulfide isomerase/thioredoxin
LILGFNGRAYEITIDTNGCNPITIKQRPDIAPPIQLAVGDQLPHFSFKLMSGDSVDVYSLMQSGKLTYIEFWGTWCVGCVQSVEKLKTLQQTKSDSLVIISLDSYDEREDAKKFVKEKTMNWTQGFSNTAIEELLYVGDGFPYGILIDRNGKIVAFDVSPGRLGRMLR